jgi:hypothetical protein
MRPGSQEPLGLNKLSPNPCEVIRTKSLEGTKNSLSIEVVLEMVKYELFTYELTSVPLPITTFPDKLTAEVSLESLK